MPDTPTRDTVYCYKFNNYYNRIIKRYDTIVEYGTPMLKQENCNFVHGDGVNSTFTINKSLTLLDTPDYVVVEDYNENISRWFVINSFKNRSGQDTLTLRRDLIADFYSDVLQYSPCLVRKGYVDNNNFLVFNDEGVQYNKKKTAEKYIQDSSSLSYIVGFIANNAEAKTGVKGTIKNSNYDFSFTDLASFPLKNYVEGAGNNHTEVATNLGTPISYALRFSIVRHSTLGVTFPYNGETLISQYGYLNVTGYNNTYDSGTQVNPYTYIKSGARENNIEVDYYEQRGLATAATEIANKFCNIMNINSSAFTSLEDISKALFPLEESIYEELQQYANKNVKIGATVYKVHLVSENRVVRNITANSTIVNYINNNIKPTNNQIANFANYGISHVNYDSTYKNFTTADVSLIGATKDYYLQFVEATNDITCDVPAANSRTHLTEQPYDMFVLINDDQKVYKIGANYYTSNHEVNMNMAQAIIQAYGTSGLDLQIVPFNPIPGSILATGYVDWGTYDVHAIKDGSNNTVGHFIFCSSADLNIKIDRADLQIHPTDYKLDHETKLYRLCSPNQETVFEFSPAMNGGVDSWEVTANYRPYASYIKVQPTWGFLYGESTYNDKTDMRGLVYNSTLCVTQLNDAWSNYVANNKNYQQLFDNQIGTLTKQYGVQIGAMEETLGWRAYTGMPLSSIARVVGGSKDIEMQNELNNLALSKMQTDFTYQMDNIKAMPHTIKKLTNINGDTRYWPYIEFYSASEVEIESFNNKMKYTGMTVMTTGMCWDFLKEGEETFIQADLIRLNLYASDETADNHIAVEIANELSKGIYITKESD